MSKIDYVHSLFYFNIPGNNPKTHRFIRSHHYFKKTKDPTIIYTGNSEIDFSEINFEKVKDKEISIYLYEPICLYTDKFNRGYYSEFKGQENLENLRSVELDSLLKISQEKNLKFKIYTCDYNLDQIKKSYPDLKIYCFDTFIRSLKFPLYPIIKIFFYDLYRYFFEYRFKFKRKFFCPNWRYTLHRHLIASYVLNLDSKITWQFKSDFSILENNDLIDLTKEQNVYQKIKEGNEKLKNINFQIDTNLKEKIKITSLEDFFVPAKQNPLWTTNYLRNIKDSFCVISNETRFFQPITNISEKTLLPFAFRRPVVICGTPYSIRYLKELGFQTFDRWWDESYDNELDHETRFFKILKVLEFINKKPIEELDIIYDEMRNVLDHNYQHYLRLKYDRTIL